MSIEPLFPESSNPALRPVGMPPDIGFYPDKRLIWIQKCVNSAEPKIRSWRKEATQAYRFADGHQLSNEDEQALKKEGRPTTAFNTIQKFRNYVCGVQRESPLTVLFNAIDLDNTGAQLFGEQVGKYYQWVRDKCRAESENARCFSDLFTVGMGWQRGAIGRAQDPRGLVILPRLNPLTMLWDVSCDKLNLGGSCSDGMTRWRAQEDWVDIEEAKSMFTSPYAQFLLDQAGIEGASVRNWPSVDRVPYIVPYVQTYPLDSPQVGGSKHVKKDRCQIMEVQWWDNEAGYVFIDPLDNTEQWMTKPEFHEHERLIEQWGLEVKDYAEQPGRKFQKAFLLNRRFFLEEPSPIIGVDGLENEDVPPRHSNRFTFNCMCAHLDEDTRMWYGFMQVLMDPQRWGNKFLNQTIELYGRQAKGGALATANSFEDVAQMKEFVATYAQPGKVNIVADLKGIQEKKLPDTPSASLAILKFIQDSLPNITGISTDAIGGGAGTAVATTLRRRQRAGMVLLTGEFEAEGNFRKDEALITFDLLYEISDDRLIRVSGTTPSDGEVLVLSRAPYSLEYEIELDAIERDPNLRQYLSELVMGPFGQTALRTGHWLPSFYNWLPIPRREIEQLKQQDMQNQQRAQQFAAMGLPPPGGRGMKKSLPMQMAETENKKADTQLKLAKAKQAGAQVSRDNLRGIFDIVQQRQQNQMDQQHFGLDTFSTLMDAVQQSRNGTAQQARNGDGTAQQ